MHFVATPYGQKISIGLEELGLPYSLIQYDIFEGHQLTADFGRINPNHKLPAIVDHDPPFGGGPNFPNTRRWLNTIAQRPAVQRGHVAEKAIPDKYKQRRAQLSPTQWSNMFGEKLHRAVPGNR